MVQAVAAALRRRGGEEQDDPNVLVEKKRGSSKRDATPPPPKAEAKKPAAPGPLATVKTSSLTTPNSAAADESPPNAKCKGQQSSRAAERRGGAIYGLFRRCAWVMVGFFAIIIMVAAVPLGLIWAAQSDPGVTVPQQLLDVTSELLPQLSDVVALKSSGVTAELLRKQAAEILLSLVASTESALAAIEMRKVVVPLSEKASDTNVAVEASDNIVVEEGEELEAQATTAPKASSRSQSSQGGAPTTMGQQQMPLPAAVEVLPLKKPEEEAPPPPSKQQPCINRNEFCDDWANNGECEKNPGYMRRKCRKACFVC